MRRMSLVRMSLVSVLAFAGMTASAAAHKKVLVLKEEGKPVAAGTEIGLELEDTVAGRCVVAWRGHMSINGASTDKMTFEPVKQECTSSGLPYPSSFEGEPTEVEITSTGKVRIDGSWLLFYELERSPGPYCTVEIEQFRDELETLGPTEMHVRGPIRLVQESRPYGGRKCPKRGIYFQRGGFKSYAIVRGHNGKPLETELIG
jgi:hypothetical protein